MAEQQTRDRCYRAVYLMQRTARDLVVNIANKLRMQANLIQRALYVNPKGLNIMIDDDVVRQMPEGQDMLLEVAEINDANEETAMKREWHDCSATDIDIDNDDSRKEQRPQVAYELKLIF